MGIRTRETQRDGASRDGRHGWPVGRIGLLALMLAGTVAVTACASVSPPSGVKPVTHFDVQRYTGTWFEIARLDHSFERGLDNVSAQYAPNPDGSLKVTNRGFDPGKGAWRESIGRAVFTGPTDVASLKVSFFGPFYGGYHVIALDPDYRWAMIAGPNRSYLWILSRSRTLDADVKQSLLETARRLGFETDALIWVDHDKHDPALAGAASH